MSELGCNSYISLSGGSEPLEIHAWLSHQAMWDSPFRWYKLTLWNNHVWTTGGSSWQKCVKSSPLLPFMLRLSFLIYAQLLTRKNNSSYVVEAVQVQSVALFLTLHCCENWCKHAKVRLQRENQSHHWKSTRKDLIWGIASVEALNRQKGHSGDSAARSRYHP